MKTNALFLCLFVFFALSPMLFAQHSLGVQGALWHTQPLQHDVSHDYQGGLSYSTELNYFYQLPSSRWQLYAGINFSNLEQRYTLQQRYGIGQPLFPNIPIDLITPQVITPNQNSLTEWPNFNFGPAESYYSRHFNSRYLGLQLGARFYALDGKLRLFLQPYGRVNAYLNTRYQQPVLIFYGPVGNNILPNEQEVIWMSQVLDSYRAISLSAGLGFGLEQLLTPSFYAFLTPAAEYIITGPLKDSRDKNFLNLGGILGLRFEL